MIFARILDSQWILPALSVLAVVLLMRRHVARRRSPRDNGAAGNIGRELHGAEQGSAARLHQMEVRLHDYGREVEGRIETNLALLDQLIAEADREIVRLESLLDSSRHTHQDATSPQGDHHIPFPASGAKDPLNAEQRHMIRLLAQSGYTAGEIAQLVDRAPDEVRSLLDHRTNHDAEAA